ncbi:unnamed protein product, partial [Polarella glacialis]
MIPKEAAQRVRNVEIWRHAAHQLQLFRTAKLRDHSPLMLTVRLGSHFSEHREPQTQWNYDTLRQNTHSKEIISKQRDFVQDINNVLLQPDTAARAQTSVATANPDKLWELINSVVTDSAKNFFTCQNFSSKRIHDSPKTAQLRQQANTQFNQLRDLPTIPLSDWITGKTATTDFLHSAFQAWRAVTQLRLKDKQLHHAVKQDRDRHFQQISKDLSQAADSNDTHRVWKLARQLARTGLGPRLRQFGITACFPSIEEWVSYLARPGRLGGCAATSATDIPLWIPPGPLNNNITVPTTTAQAEIDLDYMAIKFKQSRPYRVVPPWSAPAEVRRFIFGTDAHQQGLWQLRLLIFKLLQIIRTTGHSPYMWHHSLAKYIDKPNNKTGPAHYRVIHLLEPFSKCYHAALWEQGRHKEWSFAHGSFRHRRREAAIQQHLLLLWRLNACHLPHAALYLDVINAFPSVNRSVIDRVISLQFKEPEARLMRNHYEDARTTVTGQSAEQATLNINSGTMQGDSIGGHLFNQAFCPAVQHARKHLQLLGLTEPFALRDWLTDEPVDVATTVFADDVATVTLFPDPEQAEQTVNAVFNTFAISLAKIGMALHEDFPVVPNFHGRGSQTLMQKAITAKHPVGNWCLSARYLGAQIKLSGGEVQEINARINAANISWYALSGFWFAAEIKVQYKLRVFRANILSVLTAGLEAWVLPLSQIHRLESWRMQKLRIILQGKGTFQDHVPEFVDRTSRSHLLPQVFRELKLSHVAFGKEKETTAPRDMVTSRVDSLLYKFQKKFVAKFVIKIFPPCCPTTSIWLSVSIAIPTTREMTTEGQPPRKKRLQSQTDDNKFEKFMKTDGQLLLATASELRVVKAAAITTVIFPASHPVPTAIRKSGQLFSQAVKERKGSQTLPSPHIAAFTAMVRTVAEDKQAGKELIDAAQKVLQFPNDIPRLSTVCRVSKCFKPDQARLEVAVSPDGHVFLRQCIDLWARQGATEKLGAGPRRPLERALVVALGTCGEAELLPWDELGLPSDLFTACLMSPVRAALSFYRWRSSKVLSEKPLQALSLVTGRAQDRGTPLGELVSVFTAVTDAIAWSSLPPRLFWRLFREDGTLAER